MNEPWLNITDLARALEISEISTEQYVYKFAPLLPSSEVKGTAFYAPICVQILKQCIALLDQDFTDAEVKDILEKKFSSETTDITPFRSDLQKQDPSKSIEFFTSQVTQFMRVVADQKQEISTLRSDFSNLLQELNHERKKREALEVENTTLKKAVRFLWKEHKQEKENEQGKDAQLKIQERLDAVSEMVRFVKKDHKDLEKFLLQKIEKARQKKEE